MTQLQESRVAAQRPPGGWSNGPARRHRGSEGQEAVGQGESAGLCVILQAESERSAADRKVREREAEDDSGFV